MRAPECGDDVLEERRRDDGLDPQFRNVLLPPTLADGRRSAFVAEERPRPRRVPGATLVVADPSGACVEHGIASRVERVSGNEPDELDSRHAIVPSTLPFTRCRSAPAA